MKITLISYMPNSGNVETDEKWLGMIASQSRKKHPKPTAELFRKTIEWGHDSIQEFANYTFHIEDVSLNLLKQLTRHRIASYNVMSNRHVPNNNIVLPKGVRKATGKIYLENGNYVKWYGYKDGDFDAYYVEDNVLKNLEDCPIPLEDIRYGFPTACATNLFVQFNGRSLRNFLRLRTSKHAQWEIRELAKQMKEIIMSVHPFMVDDL